MRHRVLALAAALLLLGLSPGFALGATLDQHNTATPTMGFGSDILAQSVTAGLTGKLARVDLMVQDTSVGGGTLKVQIEGIQRATGWPPSNSVLAQGSAHISTLGWYSFALSPAISLLAGGHFAIVVNLNGSQIIESSGDTYSGGQLWEQVNTSWVSPGGDYDLDFRTYMNTPAPTAAPKKTPAPKPTPTASPTATLAPTATPSPTPTVASASPSGTAEIAAAATPAPTASASQGQPSGPVSNGGADWTLPAVAAVVVLLVLATGVWLIVRRRRRPSS